MNIFKKLIFILLVHMLITIPVFSEQNPKRVKRINQRDKDDNAPKAGEMAPVFTVTSLDGETEFNLLDFRGDKPVVLFFGSYT